MSSTVYAVSGSRRPLSEHEKSKIKSILMVHMFQSYCGGDILIHGGATGVDQYVGELARSWGYPVDTYEALWTEHGKAAGPIRNKAIAKDADIAWAFPRRGDAKGTRDFINSALDQEVDLTVTWL